MIFKLTTIRILVCLSCAFSVLFVGCKQKDNDNNDDENPRKVDTSSTDGNKLRQTIAAQDSLFDIINEFSETVEQIKQLENIVNFPINLEGPQSQSEKISSDLMAILNTLQERRRKIAELEESLKQNNNGNDAALRTIANLKDQISRQEKEISDIKEQLIQANIQIANLDQEVSTLNSSLDEMLVKNEEANQMNARLLDELNICYYALGTKKELSEKNILRTGFLRKTKIMPEDFEKSYFTQADKRNLFSIPLFSKKAEVMTNQPKSSYHFDEENGLKTLVIDDPDRFWEISNFLVVKID